MGTSLFMRTESAGVSNIEEHVITSASPIKIREDFDAPATSISSTAIFFIVDAHV